ncbi:MAG: tRNA (adenosine(37)-N6)-threonylcarbamoyltransferase complex ATPase subunit type 1 TsaE [Solirubrobacteraceae bacterium]
MQRHTTSTSSAETEAIGAEVAETLAPGDVVLIEGELGAGKTTFVRGACRALGVKTPVTSPTFTIGQRYRGRVPVSHLDLFRIAEMSQEDPDLLADYMEPETIAFVEWPEVGEDALAGLGRVAVRVVIEHTGGDRRDVRIAAGNEVRSR